MKFILGLLIGMTLVVIPYCRYWRSQRPPTRVELQQSLNDWGYPCEVDGIIGDETKTAWKSYEQIGGNWRAK